MTWRADERQWGGRVIVTVNENGEIYLSTDLGDGDINVKIWLPLEDAELLRDGLIAMTALSKHLRRQEEREQ